MIKKITSIICLLCCITTVVYIVYFTQNRYYTNSQFSLVVKDATNVDYSAGLLSMMGKGSAGNNDIQSAIGFIKSADLLLEIEEEFDLQAHYSSPKYDYIYKLKSNSSIEDRLAYYRERITPIYNTATGLINLGVDTFSPQLSFDISQNILKRTERFINTLNQEVAEKRMDFVRTELKRAEDAIKKNENDLIALQSKHKLIQPEAIIQAKLEAIQALRLERIRKEVALSTLKASSPNSPSLQSLQSTVINLGHEIAAQEKSFVGTDQKKLNYILLEFSELQVKMQFALQLRAGAELLMETTRSEAITRSRFFSVIQNPYLSEEHKHPRRLYLCLSSIAIILASFYILRALALSVYDRV